MSNYEDYLNNYFQPYTIQNNPFDVGNSKTLLTPDMNTAAQIQGELANKPVYDRNGRRYGSTLSDDMFDIKNGRRGNPETSNHPWIGDYYDYADVNEPEVPNELLNAYINSMSLRDVMGRKKNIGEGIGNIQREWVEDYDPDMYSNPDYEQYLNTLNDYNALREKQAILQGKGYGYDGIGDDVRYIKSGGKTLHEVGYQNPRIEGEYDPEVDTMVNPDRLSPRTAEMIAKNMTQYRDEWIDDETGDNIGLNHIINGYKTKIDDATNSSNWITNGIDNLLNAYKKLVSNGFK